MYSQLVIKITGKIFSEWPKLMIFMPVEVVKMVKVWLINIVFIH